jgi:hypothetical protein
MAFPPSIIIFSRENEAHIDFLKSTESEVMNLKRGENLGINFSPAL